MDAKQPRVFQVVSRPRHFDTLKAVCHNPDPLDPWVGIFRRACRFMYMTAHVGQLGYAGRRIEMDCDKQTKRLFSKIKLPSWMCRMKSGEVLHGSCPHSERGVIFKLEAALCQSLSDSILPPLSIHARESDCCSLTSHVSHPTSTGTVTLSRHDAIMALQRQVPRIPSGRWHPWLS